MGLFSQKSSIIYIQQSPENVPVLDIGLVGPSRRKHAPKEYLLKIIMDKFNSSVPFITI